jgi:hypothetical protein
MSLDPFEALSQGLLTDSAIACQTSFSSSSSSDWERLVETAVRDGCIDGIGGGADGDDDDHGAGGRGSPLFLSFLSLYALPRCPPSTALSVQSLLAENKAFLSLPPDQILRVCDAVSPVLCGPVPACGPGGGGDGGSAAGVPLRPGPIDGVRLAAVRAKELTQLYGLGVVPVAPLVGLSTVQYGAALVRGRLRELGVSADGAEVVAALRRFCARNSVGMPFLVAHFVREGMAELLAACEDADEGPGARTALERLLAIVAEDASLAAETAVELLRHLRRPLPGYTDPLLAALGAAATRPAVEAQMVVLRMQEAVRAHGLEHVALTCAEAAQRVLSTIIAAVDRESSLDDARAVLAAFPALDAEGALACRCSALVQAGRIADAAALVTSLGGADNVQHVAGKCLEALSGVPEDLRAEAAVAAVRIEAAVPALGAATSAALGNLALLRSEFGLAGVSFADLGQAAAKSAHLAGSASLPVPRLERLGTLLGLDRPSLLAEHLIPGATRAGDAALCGSLCRELLGLKTRRDGRTKAVCLNLSAHLCEDCCSAVDVDDETLGLLELSARAAALFEHAVCTCDDALILDALGDLTAERVLAAAARDGQEALEAALPARFVPLIAARLEGLVREAASGESRFTRSSEATTVNLIKLVQAARGHGAHSAQLLGLLGQAGASQCALAGSAWNLTDTHNITVDRVVASVAADILRAARSDPLALLLAVRCAVVSAPGPARSVVDAQGLVAATLAAAQVWGDEELAEAMRAHVVDLFWAAHVGPEFAGPEELPAAAGAILAAGGPALLSEFIEDYRALEGEGAAAAALAALPPALAYTPQQPALEALCARLCSTVRRADLVPALERALDAQVSSSSSSSSSAGDYDKIEMICNELLRADPEHRAANRALKTLAQLRVCQTEGRLRHATICCSASQAPASDVRADGQLRITLGALRADPIQALKHLMVPDNARNLVLLCDTLKVPRDVLLAAIIALWRADAAAAVGAAADDADEEAPPTAAAPAALLAEAARSAGSPAGMAVARRLATPPRPTAEVFQTLLRPLLLEIKNPCAAYHSTRQLARLFPGPLKHVVVETQLQIARRWSALLEERPSSVSLFSLDGIYASSAKLAPGPDAGKDQVDRLVGKLEVEYLRRLTEHDLSRLGLSECAPFAARPSEMLCQMYDSRAGRVDRPAGLHAAVDSLAERFSVKGGGARVRSFLVQKWLQQPALPAAEEEEEVVRKILFLLDATAGADAAQTLVAFAQDWANGAALASRRRALRCAALVDPVRPGLARLAAALDLEEPLARSVLSARDPASVRAGSAAEAASLLRWAVRAVPTAATQDAAEFWAALIAQLGSAGAAGALELLAVCAGPDLASGPGREELSSVVRETALAGPAPSFYSAMRLAGAVLEPSEWRVIAGSLAASGRHAEACAAASLHPDPATVMADRSIAASTVRAGPAALASAILALDARSRGGLAARTALLRAVDAERAHIPLVEHSPEVGPILAHHALSREGDLKAVASALEQAKGKNWANVDLEDQIRTLLQAQ